MYVNEKYPPEYLKGKFLSKNVGGALTSGGNCGSLSILPSWPTIEATALKESRDDRSPLALGLEWASRITTVAFEMVIPGLLGYWLDRRLGTLPLFLALGSLFGFVTGFLSLLRMTRPAKPERRDPDG
jgi:F0F1-type ATP synthase assembly protein I